MSDPIATPAALLAAMKAMRAGLKTGLPPALTQIAAEGKVSTIPEVEAELDTYILVYEAADDAELAYHAALKAREVIAPEALARFEAMRTSLKGVFGKKSPELTKVGLQPDKTPAPPTVQQKKERVDKALSTRKARGTLGPKQKAAIKGPVPPAPPPKAGP